MADKLPDHLASTVTKRMRAACHAESKSLTRAAQGGEQLAVQALVAAYAPSKTIVDESTARAVVAEVTAE